MAQSANSKNTPGKNRGLLLQATMLVLLFVAAGGLGAGAVWLWWLSTGGNRTAVAKTATPSQMTERREPVCANLPQVNPTVIRRSALPPQQTVPRVTEKPRPHGPAGKKRTTQPAAKSIVAALPKRLKLPVDISASAPWRRHAVKIKLQPGKPVVAVVLDDMGMNLDRAKQAISLPGPLTIAVLPYGPAARETAAAARRAGHEILVHLPMQPENRNADPGPYALLLGLSEKQLRRRLNWNLSRFPGYVGINNHMGSKFTADRQAMRWVMAELARRGLLFLDSYTSQASQGGAIARQYGLPTAVRDVFIDHDLERAAIRRQLAKAETLARQNGSVILIGHPHGNTLKELAPWITAMKANGLQFAPVSALVRISRNENQVKRDATLR